MKADAKTEAEIRAVIDAWIKAYCHRDLEGAMALIAPDEEAVFYGSQADEKNIGHEELRAGIERDFAQSEGIHIQMPWLSISAAGHVAWAAGDCICDVVADGHELHLAGRYTTVLEKRGEKWLIIHSHLSIPDATQPEGHSFPEQ